MPRGQYDRSNMLDRAQTPKGGNDKPQSAEIPVMESALSPRAEQVRRERRRRDDGDIDRMTRLSLAIPHEIEERTKREGKVLRWVLNKPGRMAEMHDDDWDVVQNVPHVAAGAEDEEKLVLMEKFKDWHEKDLRQTERSIVEREKAIVAATSSENRRGADDGLYVPEGQRNRISRDRG